MKIFEPQKKSTAARRQQSGFHRTTQTEEEIPDFYTTHQQKEEGHMLDGLPLAGGLGKESNAPQDIIETNLKTLVQLENGQRGARYMPAYRYFASSRSGKKFLSRFSNGKDTNWKFLKNQAPGDMVEHTLEIERRLSGGTGAASGCLLVRNNKNPINIQYVTTQDIANSQRKFIFKIELNFDEWKASGAETLGHEAFIHLSYKMDAIKKLLSQNLNDTQLAVTLRNLADTGGRGDKDHAKFLKGKTPEFETYMDDVLRLKISEKEKKAIIMEYNEEIEEYANEKHEARKILNKMNGKINVKKR